jgi:hypothetical protein
MGLMKYNQAKQALEDAMATVKKAAVEVAKETGKSPAEVIAEAKSELGLQ